MVKVAMLFLHPFSGSLGSTVRVKELAIGLSKLGAEVYILTPYEKDHIINGNVYVKSISKMWQRFGLSLPLYRLSRYAYYNRFFVRHFLSNERLFVRISEASAQLIARILKKFDIDIIQAEQDAAVMPSLRATKDLNIPVVADLHNITSEELVSAGLIKRKNKEFKDLQEITKKMLSQVDLSIVVSEEMQHYVASNYNVRDIVVVPPGGRPRIQNIEKKVPPFKVVYSGLVSYREHVDLFVRSMKHISKEFPNTNYFMTKKGESLKNAERLAARLTVRPNYFWYPRQDEFYKFLSSCHVGVVPSLDDLARKMGTPVKLFDYLSVGLPVVANAIGAWTNIIKDEKIGILTDNDPKSFASGVLKLLSTPTLLREYGERGLTLIRTRFNWDNSAKILLSHYKKLGVHL
jgi:glycosyltransferase involved in cell wall biosynthesis